ncbi:aminomethyl-transferring glycine dehydrogenase subunit GcvPA [Vineibacter terrae]|uniref:Probable glycine dehydrogenase (decarboxylating) subunit 1 n=1 Tax=Vineibacter terrae TaxID=2586908 RepID=A0A5C8P8K4_9HYPH|nr:aminomethyl-transferring glycine dehydrogenase subunit GcvPA [Vineibacter terrae]TXL69957.1 aminomethyl-transferring glycine dehydrogenase subunit GcvPA [Vineibacter terrae]
MRYLPLTDADRREMLATIGVRSIDDLFRDVPTSVRLPGPIAGLSSHMGEMEVERRLGRMAARNLAASDAPFFVGAGAYKHHVPASVDHLIQRGEFLTSYTPYQPEITQGTLQYLFEFQTQVTMLTGMEVANASMYDGSTGASEAVLMANRVTRRNKAVLSGGLHPHYRAVIETTARWQGFRVAGAPVDADGIEDLAALVDKEVSCVVVQNPSVFGHVRDLAPLAQACHAAGALLVVVVTEVVSLGLLTPPGDMGADIVVCEGQSLGVGLNFGGPYVGLFATREKLMRQMPGRLVGETVDADGKRGFVLTLSTREQHIRREKATSNICTNAGLCALAFTIHLTLLGERGFTRLAELNHATAVRAAERLARVPGVKVLNDSFFNEFTVMLPKPAAPVVEALAERRILAGVPVSRLLPHAPLCADLLLVAVTETVSDDDIEALAAGLEEVL